MIAGVNASLRLGSVDLCDCWHQGVIQAGQLGLMQGADEVNVGFVWGSLVFVFMRINASLMLSSQRLCKGFGGYRPSPRSPVQTFGHLHPLWSVPRSSWRSLRAARRRQGAFLEASWRSWKAPKTFQDALEQVLRLPGAQGRPGKAQTLRL